MTPQERKVFELALEALTHGGCPPDCKDGMTDSGGVHPWGEAVLIPCPNCQTITAIKEALAQPEQDNTYIYASSLATAIWQKHYMKESPKFALFDTTEGVLTQIDNMTCGLVREKPAQPEQEPVAWMFQHEETGRTVCIDAQQLGWGFEKGNPRLKKIAPLYTTLPQQRTWVGLTDEERDAIFELHHTRLGGWDYSGDKAMYYEHFEAAVAAIEAKIKHKNT